MSLQIGYNTFSECETKTTHSQTTKKSAASTPEQSWYYMPLLIVALSVAYGVVLKIIHKELRT
jgi:hypothetical protein